MCYALAQLLHILALSSTYPYSLSKEAQSPKGANPSKRKRDRKKNGFIYTSATKNKAKAAALKNQPLPQRLLQPQNQRLKLFIRKRDKGLEIGARTILAPFQAHDSF